MQGRTEIGHEERGHQIVQGRLQQAKPAFAMFFVCFFTGCFFVWLHNGQVKSARKMGFHPAQPMKNTFKKWVLSGFSRCLTAANNCWPLFGSLLFQTCLPLCCLSTAS